MSRTQGHEYGPDHGQGHEHPHGAHPGRLDRIKHAFIPHSHDTGGAVDEALTTSRDGMRTLWISLAILGATASAQAVVVWISGSVALLGDTVHNRGDALTRDVSGAPPSVRAFGLHFVTGQ